MRGGYPSGPPYLVDGWYPCDLMGQSAAVPGMLPDYAVTVSGNATAWRDEHRNVRGQYLE